MATHAYTVAPGYAELEQGARAFGVEGVREATAWDFNLKIGVRRGVQLGVFGPAYLRTSAGVGVGDLGVAIKFARAVSSRTAVAVVLGIGAGTPQWFTSVGLSRGGRVGAVTELFDFTKSGAGPRQRGFLAAAVVQLAEWAVLDAGGALGLSRETPDQLFIGLTTNLGRIFK